ncbi:MAG: Mur ligase family protein [bacterium]|nr:Mur ligase family protein [bacterium]
MNEVEQLLASFIPPPRSQRANYDLKRMKKLMNQLGNPQDSYQVIHVAGTSGKTSTCYYLSELLKLSGFKTGLTVSPHVESVGERVQINGISLSDDDFLRYFKLFSDQAKLEKISPTYFEVLVAFAYWYFAYQKVEIAVIETGIGGLLDATNVVANPNKLCVITDIGIDHTLVLGDTISQITAQKAGIIQLGNSVFMLNQSEEIERIIADTSHKNNASLSILNQTEESQHLPLFQKRNFSLARQVVGGYFESIDKQLSADVVTAASKIQVPARMEVFIINGKTIILDGGHNPQKLSQFVRSFMDKFPNQKPLLLCAMLYSGDIRIHDNVAELVGLEPTIVIATEFTSNQDLKKVSVRADKLAKEFMIFGYEVDVQNSGSALKKALDSDENIIVITGSLYLLFDLRPSILALKS